MCRETLLEAAAARRTADRSRPGCSRWRSQVVHLFPVDADTPVACWRDPLLTTPDEGDPILDHLAGSGTPMVAERAVEELAAALDVSYGSACGLVAGRAGAALPPPPALGAGAGRVVAGVEGPQDRPADHAPGPRGGRVRRRPSRDRRREEPARAEPDRAGPPGAGPVRTRERPPAARRPPRTHRDVTFDYHDDDTLGSATLYATLDLVDAHDLDATVSDLANQLGRLGDQSPLGAPPRRALGAARPPPDRALDLFGATRAEDQRTAAHGPRRSPAPPSTCTSTGDDLRRTAEDGEHHPRGRREARHHHPRPPQDLAPTVLRHHPQTSPGHGTRTDAVDQHDPPAWMRDLVILRDGHCVFPGCTIDARRCDLDHIDPYVPIDEGGPPGQTSPCESGVPVPATPPAEDLHQLALRTRRPRHLRLDQPTRPHLHERTTAKH